MRDPWEKNVPGLGLGRDPERTPMQWDAAQGAGFTDGDPWLPLSADRANVNVEAQRADPRSMFSLYRQLIALRRREPALSIGVHVKAEAVGEVLTYRRFHKGRWITVALNFSDAPQQLTAPAPMRCCSRPTSIACNAKTAWCSCARTKAWCWRRRRELLAHARESGHPVFCKELGPRVRGRAELQLHRTAIGETVEPVPPWIFSGCMMKANS